MTSRSWARSGRSWARALDAMRQDRTARPEIREERLRTVAGLRGSPAVALSAWRGRSGRRYVVGVHEITPAGVKEAGDAVLIAVHRGADGWAQIVAVPQEPRCDTWWLAVQMAGANELHVHRLADARRERLAIVRDLRLECREQNNRSTSPDAAPSNADTKTVCFR